MTTPTTEDETAWEHWDDLGDRLERAIASLTSLAEDSVAEDRRERLTAKAEAVRTAYDDWGSVSRESENDPRPRVSVLQDRLTERQRAAQSVGARSGYSLAFDYTRALP